MLKWTMSFAVNRLLVIFLVYMVYALAQNTSCHVRSYDPVTILPDFKQSYDEMMRALQ